MGEASPLTNSRNGLDTALHMDTSRRARELSSMNSGTIATFIRGLLITTPWLVLLFLANVLLSLLLLVKPFMPNRVHELSSQIAFVIWRSVQAIFVLVNGADILITSDDDEEEEEDVGDRDDDARSRAPGVTSFPPAGESAIIIANHVAWTDFYLIQALALRCRMLGRCRWFAKKELRWVPLLGWGLWAMGMPLVSRRWTTDERELERALEGVVERHWPTWLIIYCETTRYTPAKAAAAATWCAARAKPMPQHLLYPRTKGFVRTVQRLRRTPHVKAVYDVSLAYWKRADGGKRAKAKEKEKVAAKKKEDPTAVSTAAAAAAGTTTTTTMTTTTGFMRAPSIWESLSLPGLSASHHGFRFVVNVRRFSLAEMPETDEALAQWLEERWVEKGRWLEGRRRCWEEEAEDGDGERRGAEKRSCGGGAGVKERAD